MNDKKIYGPEPTEQLTPQVLCDRLRQALESKSIEFTTAALHEHVLMAAIDFVNGDSMTDGVQSVANSVARPDVIAMAIREHASVSQVTSLQAFTNQTLVDAGHEPLMDAELLELPTV